VQYLDVAQVVDCRSVRSHGCRNDYVATLRQKNAKTCEVALCLDAYHCTTRTDLVVMVTHDYY
jgi:hypothetical protein